MLLNKNAKKKKADKLIKKYYIQEDNRIYSPSENLKSEDLELLASQKILQGITSVKLSSNPIGPQPIKFIVQANWIHLTNLQLKNCYLGSKGIKFLAKGNWQHLIQLRIGFNQIANQGICYLTQCNWPKLQKLWLQGNHIGLSGMKRLTHLQAPGLEHLRENKVYFQASKYITKMQLNCLKHIDITYIKCQAETSKHLKDIIQQRFPNSTQQR